MRQIWRERERKGGGKEGKRKRQRETKMGRFLRSWLI